MAGLIATGAVRVETLAVDGMRLQAAANRGTFRRSERLAMLEKAALEVVRRLRAEVDEDPAAAQRRTIARRLAVAEDRARRLDKARQAQAEIERQREEQRQKQRRRNERKDTRSPRLDRRSAGADHEDGRWQLPAGLQRAVQDGGRSAHIIGVSVTDCGSDHGLL